MIERQLKNILYEKKIKKDVVTLITQVIVDINDPAFKEPTKPIGPYYIKEEADLLSRVNNWVFKEDLRKKGWRRIVASPKPKNILNKRIIKNLAHKGIIIIAAGGGGVPVYIDENRRLEGIDAVIDKDLASSLLATEVGADELFILTDVPKVYLNYKKTNQVGLDQLKLNEAISYYNEGQFASGSMGPKILAAIEFIKNGGKETIITDAAQLSIDKKGTRIVP